MISVLARWVRWQLEWRRAHRTLRALRPFWQARAGESDDDFTGRIKKECRRAHEP